MILRANMRNRDLLSRLGGEELAVLLPDTGAIKAGQIAERLRLAIETLEIHWEGQTISITASFGVAVAWGTTPSTDMFVHADAALYAAKRGGRNRVVFSGDVLLGPVIGEDAIPMPAASVKTPGRAA